MRPTPLQPREFFDGAWKGEGELRCRGILGLIRRPDRFRYTNSGRWVSNTRKEFEDCFEFNSGRVMRTQFTAEIVDKRRLRITSDAMPGGADIVLSEGGYTYTSYTILTRSRPITVRLRCRDVNVVDEHGMIHDRVEMSWYRLPLATLTMTIQVDRSGSPVD